MRYLNLTPGQLQTSEVSHKTEIRVPHGRADPSPAPTLKPETIEYVHRRLQVMHMIECFDNSL